MNKMIAKHNTKGAVLPKSHHIDNSQDVNLFVGMAIITYKNCKAMDIVNNETFKITDIYDQYVKFGNKRV
jgi:hypothetical protein